MSDVLGEWPTWLDAQPPAPPDVADDDAREIVRAARGYLTTNRTRRDDPRYPRLGLPITSTLMDSLIKEISDRVKGPEKFWNNPEGANHIPAVKAAALSDDDRLLTLT